MREDCSRLPSAHRDMSKLAPARWFLHSGRAIS
jgi:hypothetical protein